MPLKAGTNVITMKVASGSHGFGVWPTLSMEEPDTKPPPLANLRFNAPLDPTFDSYIPLLVSGPPREHVRFHGSS